MRVRIRPERGPPAEVPIGGRREGEDARGGEAMPGVVPGGGEVSTTLVRFLYVAIGGAGQPTGSLAP